MNLCRTHLGPFFWLALATLLSMAVVTMAIAPPTSGGCSCMTSTADTAQSCLNKLVLVTQRGLAAPGAYGAPSKDSAPQCYQLTSPDKQQQCINGAIISQQSKTKQAPCASTDQKCINNAICFMYRFAMENFQFIGSASMDTDTKAPDVPMTEWASPWLQVDKYGTPWVQVDKNNRTVNVRPDNSSFSYAQRVVPSGELGTKGTLYQAWAINAINTAVTGLPGLISEKTKLDPTLDAKSPSDAPRTSSGRKLSYIFPPDDRTQVNPTTSYPWSAAVLIQFGLGAKNYSCSGTLIYKNAVLTAGHCVHKGSGGVWASNVRISPGANDAAATAPAKRPYGTVTGIDHMTTYKGWAEGGNFKYDMAVIKLTSNIGDTTGWLGMMSSNSFNNNLNAIGYPGDKPRYTQWYYYCPSVSDSWSSDSVTYNTCDIWPGQSGSGNYYKNSEGKRYVRGITSYQTCTCTGSACTYPTSCGAPYANYLQQLTSTRFTDAKSWAGIP